MLRSALVVSASLFALAFGGSAQALVIQGSSSAFDVTAEFTDPQPASGGPVAMVSGTAPPVYNLNDNAVNLQVPAPPDTIVTADSSDVNASSDVDGGFGVRNADADATLVNPGVDLMVLVPDVLELMAQGIASSASVGGDLGALTPSGSATLTSATLSVFGGPPVALSQSPGANETPVDLLGLTVILNEQVVAGDGSSSSSILVNAIRIIFDNVPSGLDVVNGEIILAQSQAELLAVPEPVSMGLLLAGLAILGASQRRRGR